MSVDAVVRIRPIAPADIDRIVEIAADAEDAPQWPRRAYEELLDPSSKERVAMVAEDSRTGVVVGFVVAGLVRPEAELESIAVSVPFQRRGVARRLFAAMADELGLRHVRQVLLEVRESNHAARALYGKLGFAEEGRRPGYYADPIEDGVLMRMQIW